MDQLSGTLVFAVLAIGVLFYSVRAYASTARRGAVRDYGLEPGEHAAQRWVGELGEIDGGSPTPRASEVAVLLTSKGRLLLVCEGSDGAAARHAFDSPDAVVVRHVGEGSRSINGGASACFEFASHDLAPLRVLLHESALPYLSEWEIAAAGAA